VGAPRLSSGCDAPVPLDAVAPSAVVSRRNPSALSAPPSESATAEAEPSGVPWLCDATKDDGPPEDYLHALTDAECGSDGAAERAAIQAIEREQEHGC